MSLERHPLSAVPTTKRRPTRNKRGYQNLWDTLASMVKAIPEDDVRQVMANHISQFFIKQPRSAFNAESWQARTGGTLTGPTCLREPGDG